MSENYFNQSPTPGNLIKGAYHYFLSNPKLGGNNPGVTGGTVPTPTRQVKGLSYLSNLVRSARDEFISDLY